MAEQEKDGKPERPKSTRERRRLMVTQLLKSPVLDPSGVEVGRLEDFIVKLSDGGYPPVTGFKVRQTAQQEGTYVGKGEVAQLEPGAVRLTTSELRTEPFQRRPGEVLLAADVLGRHAVDVQRGRIVQAHDLVLAQVDDGWRLLGIDRSPQAMLRRLVPRRGRPDLRRHVIVDWKEVQPFVGHVPTAKLLMPLQRLRRLHPAQIADIVEGASHEEGEEIIRAVGGDAELTADVFEELDPEHQVEFLKSRSNEDAAKVLDRMAPDDAADLLGELDQERRLPVLNHMSAGQQHKLRKLLQYHPTTAGGMMSPDYIAVQNDATVERALEIVRADTKTSHQLLNAVFVVQPDGKFLGTLAVVDLVRAKPSQRVQDLDLVNCAQTAGADVADVTLMMADYNLTSLAVVDSAGTLLGAISVDDLLEALVPEDWRSRVEASTGV